MSGASAPYRRLQTRRTALETSRAWLRRRLSNSSCLVAKASLAERDALLCAVLEIPLGEVLAARRGSGVRARELCGVCKVRESDLRPSRRTRGESPARKARLGDVGGSGRRLADIVFRRLREAADVERLALGRLSQKAVRRGVEVSVSLDRRAEGGALGRTRGQQDRGVFAAADVDPVRRARGAAREEGVVRMRRRLAALAFVLGIAAAAQAKELSWRSF